ncbi:MAG TPA: M20/M25/M40 family metallo-hydrolase [Solirubrobacteraceae bacterium]|nr:M20/M25/M40 family metallo-hydrolase [Solirubrobacteraceae bacterium]
MNAQIAADAEAIAARAEADLAALVDVSTPSGDVPGAEEAARRAVRQLPPGAAVERLSCSTPGCADDLLARLSGTGAGRVLLLGHLDTVVDHGAHQSMRREGPRLYGSGTADMKGGDVLALGVARQLAARASDFAEIAVLLVTDEEWRTVAFSHVERFAGWDACLCFEAGEQTPDGDDAVVVKRKAAGTLRVRAVGRAAHSGSAPHKGLNALLGLAHAAIAGAGAHDPAGDDRLTVVPTVVRSGEAFNVVPAGGELLFDMRSDRQEAFARVVAAIPDAHEGVTLTATLERSWPAMDSRAQTAALLTDAGAALGRPIRQASRGGASDASHYASSIPLTIDGLGPRGGGAHTPGEFVLASSLRERAEVALAVIGAVLARS